ncbi:MAG TPA: hypothetical protein VFJ29_07255 [Candidatus Kapabacteria bacterium]|nr:hypothetical protein [Candidatus Kapabacteria bacterium]
MKYIAVLASIFLCFGVVRAQNSSSYYISTITAGTNGVIFMGTYDHDAMTSRLYRSTTDGITWDSVASFSGDVIQIVEKPHGSMFVCTLGGENSVYTSRDSGRSWSAANNGIAGSFITGLTIAPNGDLFASENSKGLYRTTNNGGAWQRVEGGLPHDQVFDVCVNKSGYIFASMPKDGLYISHDNGGTWEKSTLPQANDAVIALAAGPKGEVYGATLKTIIVSDDNGASWQVVCQKSNGPGETQLLALDDGTLLIRSMSEGVFRSADGGATWHKVIDRRGVGNLLCADVSPDGYVFVGTGDGAVFRSGDKGEHWELVENAGLK